MIAGLLWQPRKVRAPQGGWSLTATGATPGKCHRKDTAGAKALVRVKGEARAHRFSGDGKGR